MKIMTKENTFSVVTADGTAGVFLKPARLTEVLSYFQPDRSFSIALAKVGHALRSLNETIDSDCRIDWVPLDSPAGRLARQATLILILTRAAAERAPGLRLIVDHSIGRGRGLYCELRPAPLFQPWTVRQIRKRMAEIIGKAEPVEPVVLTEAELNAFLEQRGETAAWHPVPGTGPAVLYRSGGVMEYLGMPLLHETSAVGVFDLVPWKKGMILRFPDGEGREPLPPFIPDRRLFRVFQEFGEWEAIQGVETARDLNRIAADGGVSDLIKIAESLHEKKIAFLADRIQRRRKRIVFIAGPSSSGKTTFTKRLNIQLRVNGLRPLMVSMDDYFLNRDRTPLGEDGRPDYESVTALDVPRLCADLAALLEGRAVRLPRYDFLTGKGTDGPETRLVPEQPVLIEGLHGMNDAVSAGLSRKKIFRIYDSALTQLNLTDRLRVSTSDIRFMRRMVRDAQFRNHTAADSLAAWPLVRRGEDRYIFPFQENADAVFNSALLYEPGVLRVFAEPLLSSIPKEHPEYPEAGRLLGLLLSFTAIPADEVPRTSILREFIGGSGFKY
ncbi:nucleoside kinase [bacterium]|nr:nucleoside kinase [bacterium]